MKLHEVGRVAQGIYYVATGIWPVLHERSFERVTGRKKERWLVKTVGGLIVVIGIETLRTKHRFLGIGAALVLGGIDLVYVARGRISPIYAVDALAEAAIVAMRLSA